MGAPRDRQSAPGGAVSAERISDGLAELGVAANEAQVNALHRYMAELELWNRKRDLVKAEGETLVVRHLLDSLAGLEAIRGELERTVTARTAAHPGNSATAAMSLFDLGSGGGFPGIPLAVFLPDVQVTLVERSARKCAFLRGVAAVTGLSNLRVVQADYREIGENAVATGNAAAEAESSSAGAGPEAGADVVVFRALAAVEPEFAATLARMLKPSGSVVAYKGRHENAASEAEAGTGYFVETEVIPITVPGLDEQRSLLVFRSSRESS